MKREIVERFNVQCERTGAALIRLREYERYLHIDTPLRYLTIKLECNVQEKKRG